jgi:hypothetical protein
LILIGLAAFGFIAIAVLTMLEERGRPEVIVIAIVAIVVVDALMYPSGGSVPAGILHPTIMGHDYRIPDLLIPAALIARLLVRGLPRRVTGTGLLWFTFFGLFIFAAFLGLANGHSSTLVIFQSKFVVETGGMAILAAGIPLERRTLSAFVGKAAWTLGLVSLLPILAGAARHYVGLPFFKGAALGTLGADAATTLLSLGFLLFIVEVCAPSPRLGVLAWCGLMIVCPIFTGQRAALVGMLVALLCAFVVVVGRPWRSRSRARLTQLLPIVAILVIPLGTAAVLNGRTSAAASNIPAVSTLQGRFTGVGKSQSADIRLAVWTLGRHWAEERPVLGWGLGQDFSVFQSNGSEDPFTGGDFHNIAIDLAVTTGLVGLGLFSLALTSTLWNAFITWRRARSSEIAALALGAGILLIQLVAKGLFESIFQKYRLALLFGLLIGIVAAAARASESDVEQSDRREPAWI